MSAWRCVKGSCLLIPSGPLAGQKHLFSVLMDPVAIDGYGSSPCVLIVGITSLRPGVSHDDACVLRAAEHPFLTHDSYVDYRYARVERSSEIEEKVAAGLFNEKQDCSPELLKKIISGALKSRRISRELRSLLETVLFG